MTEAEWLGSTDPIAMVYWLCRSNPTDNLPRGCFTRKIRLCACACCRRIWQMLTDPRSQYAVAASEQFADGLVTGKQLFQAHQQAILAGYDADPALRGDVTRSRDDNAMCRLWAADAARHVATGSPHAGATSVLFHAALAAANGKVDPDRLEKHQQVALLRDIFGNPFRPVTVDPAWRTFTVVSLAQGIYDERAFDRLPILADALEDAGCTNVDMLNHCREPGDHVRGCWPVDLLLGKE